MKEKRAKYKEFRSNAIKRGDTSIPVFEEWCDKNDDQAEEEEVIVKTEIKAVKNVVKVEEMDDSTTQTEMLSLFSERRVSSTPMSVFTWESSSHFESSGNYKHDKQRFQVSESTHHSERNVARIEKNKNVPRLKQTRGTKEKI